jgi:DNA-binding GntR family transcriptional regulator
VREALLQLARQGIVQPVRNRGFRVVATSPKDLQDIFEVRMWLEVPAARLAVERGRPSDIKGIRVAYTAMLRSAKANNESQMWKFDRAFHLALMSASGNRQAALYVDSLRDLVLRRGRLTLGVRSLVEIAEDHLPIIVAVEDRSGAEAAKAMRAHLTRTASLLSPVDRVPTAS